MNRLARLEIDLSAIAANWRAMAALAPKAETAAVIKADGYGLGAPAAARALAAAGARTFFTATLEEALEARAALGSGPRIIALNGLDDRPQWRDAAIHPLINTAAQAALWRAMPGLAAPVVHIDTGMNRLGLSGGEINEAAALLAGIEPALVMSHLACASEAKMQSIERQRQAFVAAAQAFAPAPKSLAASAGACLGETYHFDLIRPGIALYGGAPLVSGGPNVRPVATLLAPILQIRTLSPGDAVGYGETYIAQKPVRVATLGLGYADGVLRSLSNTGYGVIDGAHCAFLGRVSMDLIVIDIDGAPKAALGDWVELLGPSVPLADFAARADRIHYEVLTGLARVARFYTGSGV